jgi:hypothetical protein
MSLQSHLSFSDEGCTNVATLISNELALFIGVGFWQRKSEEDD